MRPDGWHLSEDIDDFLTRAGDFLRSRPALHTMHLTRSERLRAERHASREGRGRLYGWLEQAGEVHAALYLQRGLSVTALTAEQADLLAAHLGSLSRPLQSISADLPTASWFADAWRRRTGATSSLRVELHLLRLGTLTPPEPTPAGRARLLGERDHVDVVQWCRDFAADVGETVTIDATSWAGTRFAEKSYTFWETPDGTPVSMAGVNPLVAGQIRIDPVYTPVHRRGHGYAGAVTAEVTRAALTAGATDVVLFTNAANPTSNALYRRLGFVPIADFATYNFTPAKANASRGNHR